MNGLRAVNLIHFLHILGYDKCDKLAQFFKSPLATSRRHIVSSINLSASRRARASNFSLLENASHARLRVHLKILIYV